MNLEDEHKEDDLGESGPSEESLDELMDESDEGDAGFGEGESDEKAWE